MKKCKIDFYPRANYRKQMFDDERPKPKTKEFLRNMDALSIHELTEYIDELKTEIQKAEADIAKKKASQDAAANFFKS